MKKEMMNLLMPIALFWVVMFYFIATTPNYLEDEKTPQIEEKHIQSEVLDAYGALLTKNQAQ